MLFSDKLGEKGRKKNIARKTISIKKKQNMGTIYIYGERDESKR